MAQRLFLNGIESKGGEPAVVQRNDGAVMVGTGAAEACLTVLKTAMMKTKRTNDAHKWRTTSKRWMV